MPRRLLALAAALLAVPTAPAQSVWNAADGNWNTAGNWLPAVVPASGPTTVLTFGGAAGYTSTNDIGPFTLNQLNFAGAGAKTIAAAAAANRLTLAGAAPGLTVAADAGAVTVATGLTYASAAGVSNASGNLLTLSAGQDFLAGVVAGFGGTGDITQAPVPQPDALRFADGSGVTYTGSGTLRLGPQGVNAAAGSLNTVNFANGGTYTFTNGAAGGGSTGNLSLPDNASGGANNTLLYRPATNVTINLVNNSSGLLTIGNFGGMSGRVVVQAGTVRFGIVGGTANTGGDLFGGSQVLEVAAGATFDFNGNGETMGGIAGAGTLRGANVTAQITGTNTFAGNFATNNFSTLANVNYVLTGDSQSTGTLTAAAGSTVSLGAGGTTGSWAGNIAAPGTLRFDRSNALTVATTISGAATGSVVQAGTGTTTLAGTNTYAGSTVVSNGTLAIATAAALPAASTRVTVGGGVLDLSAVGGYTFGAGRTLTVGRTGTPANDVLGGVTVDAGTLAVGGVGTAGVGTFRDDLTLSGATARFDLSSNPAAGNDRVAVGGGLTLAGTTSVQVNLLSGALGTGSYPLFSYAGALTGGVGNLSLAGLGAGTTRQTFALDAGTGSNSAVSLTVSGSPASLTWTGGTDSTWDLVTTAGNFSGAADTRFYNLDGVTFAGAAPGPVTLAGTLEPSAVTVNAAADYTFTGAGLIGGSGPLTKSGTGTLTVETANTSTGATTVSGGTLALGTTTGSIAASASLIVTGATVTTVRTATLPTVTAVGAGGTVRVGAINNFAGPGVAVGLDGGTLAFTGGSGTPAEGAVTVTVGSAGGTIDVAAGFTATFRGNQVVGATGTLTKTGAGTFQFGSSGTSNLGNILVTAGVLRVTSQRTNDVGGLTVSSGAQYQINDDATGTFRIAVGVPVTLNGAGPAGSPIAGAFAVTDQSPDGTAPGGPVTTFASPVVLASDTTVGVYNGNTAGRVSSLTFGGAVSGAGRLTKVGPGVFTLGVAGNTYAGTRLEGGTLRLGAADALPATALVELAGGNLSTGAAAGFGSTAGPLRVPAASGIVLGSGDHTLTFAGLDNTGFAGLTVFGWTGTAGGGGTGGKLVFTDASGFTPAVLSNILFDGYQPGAVLIAGNQLVPVPEPAGVLAVAVVGLLVRRRRMRFDRASAAG